MLKYRDLDQSKYYLRIIDYTEKANKWTVFDLLGRELLEVSNDDMKRLTSDDRFCVYGGDNKEMGKNTVLSVESDSTALYYYTGMMHPADVVVLDEGMTLNFKAYDATLDAHYKQSVTTNELDKTFDMRKSFKSDVYNLIKSEGVKAENNGYFTLTNVTKPSLAIPEGAVRVLVYGDCEIGELTLPESCKVFNTMAVNRFKIGTIVTGGVRKLGLGNSVLLDNLVITGDINLLYEKGLYGAKINNIEGKLKLLFTNGYDLGSLKVKGTLDLSECVTKSQVNLGHIDCEHIVIPNTIKSLSIDIYNGNTTIDMNSNIDKLNIYGFNKTSYVINGNGHSIGDIEMDNEVASYSLRNVKFVEKEHKKKAGGFFGSIKNIFTGEYSKKQGDFDL